ncbi:unnamed protein product [Rotaria sordida]|uniref:Reverse transcriptase domain-containing protein n=1 Tax=Rotaria sordida TaxID=392033 RepID=A0A819DQ67_9BILA|nr:unnamed protein product [Rotaria sordida]
MNISNPEKDDEIILLNNDNEVTTTISSSSIRDKHKMKTYLQGFKILAYLKDRVNDDQKLKFDLKDVFNEVCAYAKNTIETYDKWVHNHCEAQVWQRFYDLGKHKDHWAKEVVNITHTWEAKTNIVLCEKKISHFTSAYFDANNIIIQNTRELSATVIANRAHNLMLDYIKEATKGLSKTSINRIRHASIEKDEWDALKAFEDVASEQQKIYAKTFCKPALKAYQKKKKNFDLVAAHISYDIVPKILPQDYVFNLPMDENSLSSEQVQENKVNIHKLSRDFRLKATELYLKIVKEEFEFQKERLEKLLEDSPQDSNEMLPLTQTVNDEEPFDDDDEVNINNNDEVNINNNDEEILTQKPRTPKRRRKKFEATQTVIRKTDKSKVFHLGKVDDYKVKAQIYMTKTKAYQVFGTTNPLEFLVERTNNFLYGLWCNKHITQKQYEKLKVRKDEAELAHLYFLPKAYKPGKPLKPIMSGLKSPTIAISRWLDGTLRPLFNRLASDTTITNGVQLIKQVESWSAKYLTPTTSFVTIDVTGLYTMIPQERGITAIKRLIEASNFETNRWR